MQVSVWSKGWALYDVIHMKFMDIINTFCQVRYLLWAFIYGENSTPLKLMVSFKNTPNSLIKDTLLINI